MTDSAANEEVVENGAPAITYEEELAQLRARQNLGLAIVAGLGAALIGALLWALIAYVTEMELGLVAIAVGALVGYAVRRFGNGVDMSFSVIGGVCAALGWAAGTVLGDIFMLAKVSGQPIADTASTLGLGGAVSLAMEAGDVISLVFLGIAVYEGWRFARHHV